MGFEDDNDEAITKAAYNLKTVIDPETNTAQPVYNSLQ